MSSSLSTHRAEKKIFIHEDDCIHSDGSPYTVTTLSYVSSGVTHTLTLFSNAVGFPEFIKTNERNIPFSWYAEGYEGNYQNEEDEENTDDNETG